MVPFNASGLYSECEDALTICEYMLRGRGPYGGDQLCATVLRAKRNTF